MPSVSSNVRRPNSTRSAMLHQTQTARPRGIDVEADAVVGDRQHESTPIVAAQMDDDVAGRAVFVRMCQGLLHDSVQTQGNFMVQSLRNVVVRERDLRNQV